MKKMKASDLKKAMGISDQLAKLNAERYAKFEKQPSKQACLAFDGPAYRGMHAEDFSAQDQSFAQGSIRVLSGLYGVLRPFDTVQPYRLEMGTKLATSRGKTLYDFWGDDIAKRLGEELKGKKVLVNCASQEYWKAVRPTVLPKSVQVITCDFPGPAVYAKKARGMMCRHIVKKRASRVEDLKGFKGEGVDAYIFSAAKSTASKLVFLRSKGKGGAGSEGRERSGGDASAKKRPASSAASGPAKKRKRA